MFESCHDEGRSTDRLDTGDSLDLAKLDPHDFFTTLAAADGLAVVVFVKPGCGACKAMLAALERVALAGSCFVVDAEDGPGLVADFELFHFPGVFVWRDGEYHAAIEAAPTPAAVQRAIQAALAAEPEPEPGERVD